MKVARVHPTNENRVLWVEEEDVVEELRRIGWKVEEYVPAKDLEEAHAAMRALVEAAEKLTSPSVQDGSAQDIALHIEMTNAVSECARIVGIDNWMLM